ncbi:MAG: hypothetical protein OEQ74_04160 [Gammaproteobacteria bacterium]|nr:hypothetical protein [Gammaproteobacteria bacterium]
MPNKTVPVSVRLPREDALFLDALSLEGAETASEKLRALISDARKRQHGTEEYPAALRLAQENLAPTLRIVRDSERNMDMHSELISRLGEWLPDCMAYLIACNGAATELDQDALTNIERGLAERAFVLIQSILQMGVTQSSSCYDPSVISKRLDTVMDLADVISRTRSKL